MEQSHKDPKWECYTARHGTDLGKTSSGKIRANTRKWESGAPPAHETVERLTQVVQSSEADTTHLRKERDQLLARIARAEASVDAAQTELQKIADAPERAQESERCARDEAAELRGQLKARDDRGKK